MSKLVLHQIELCNFKSFAGEVQIGPFSPFSAIIGPNGAGKSNILDSLAFCLLLDPKPRSTNYIYSTPENSDSKSCYVRVTLQRLNPKKKQPKFITFEHKLDMEEGDNGQPVFTDSFFVDSEETDKEEYVKAIENVGITPLCFVKQAQVDEVARMSPQELTTLFETYSGSIKYAQRYEELRIQLESAQQELSIIEKRRRTTQTEKQHLIKSQQEARNYEDLEKKLKDTEIEFALFQLFHLQKKYNASTEGKDELDAQIQSETAELSNKESSRREAQSASNDFKDQLSQVENTIQKAEQAIRDLRSKLASEEERKEFYSRSVVEKKNRIISKENASDAYKQQIETYKAEIEKIEAELVNLPDPGSLRADMSKYNSIRAQSSRLYSDIAQKLNQAKAELNRAEDDLTQTSNDLASAQASLARTQETIENIKAEREQYNAYKRAEDQKKSEASRQLKLLTTNDHVDRQSKEKKAAELADKQRKYDELKRAMGSSKRKEKFLKTVNNLKRLVPGVHGCLGELYRPQRESFQKAINAGIGSLLDALVCKDRQICQRCLEYFKEQSAGIVRTIPTKGLEWKQKKIASGITPLSKLIVPVSDEFRPVFEYVCSGIVYAKTYEEGQRLAFEHGYNVVTHDGVYIDHHGIITTGLVYESHSYNAKELANLADAVAKLEKEIDQLNDDVERRRPEIEKLNDDIDAFDSHIKGYDMKLRELDDKLKQYESNHRTISARIRQLEKDRQQLENVHREREEAYQREQGKQDELDKKLFEDIKLESGESIKDVEKKYNRRIALERRRDLLNDFIPSDDKLDPSQEIEDLKTKLEQDRENFNQSEASIKALNAQIAEKKQEINELQAKFTDLRIRHENVEMELIQLNREIRSVTESIDQARSSFAIEEHELNTTKQAISAVLQHCVLSNIPLPHTEDYNEREITSTLSNESQIQEDFDEIQYIDFRKLSAANKSVKGDQYVSKQKNYESTIQKMTQEYAQSKPDLASSKKYEKIEKEIDDMKAEADKADALVKQTKAEFKTVKENRRRLFLQLYDYLDNHINPLYQLFTQRRANDHGGVAYLAMEDTDEPYAGGIKFTAMPPHKRFRDLDQLSGGEKAIASLSLIIALQEYLKAPFVLLDEPDASLDKVNLTSAAMALRNESQKEGDDDEQGLQVICVSLSDKYFSTADALIGVYKESNTQSSGILTLSLEQYREGELKMEEI